MYYLILQKVEEFATRDFTRKSTKIKKKHILMRDGLFITNWADSLYIF